MLFLRQKVFLVAVEHRILLVVVLLPVVVMLLSALKGAGLEDFWGLVQQHQQVQKAQGLFIQRRQNQSLTWMNERIQAGLQSAFKENPAVKKLWPELTALVLSGQLAPSTASRRLLQANQNHPHSSGDIHA
jgi:LAO/AO transport system kinase